MTALPANDPQLVPRAAAMKKAIGSLTAGLAVVVLLSGCNDGTYSSAAHHQGACSRHGGVKVFYE